jgi:DNA polymerase-1
MNKLLLIDGNAMMHRAYHALPPLTNVKGEPIQAVYGFFSMLFNVLQDQKPTHLVVCFDRGAPTIRQSMYVGYHAHRPKMSEDFVPQVDVIHELLERMNVRIFELDGYEGDDLIGSIADQAQSAKRKAQNLEIIILTGDRDMLQLVNHHVKVLMPLVGITKTVLFDEKRVEEKYGIHPKQFVDYKALIGDPSDGYPGVTGIGPKTAASLLQKYGTFENLYKKVGELPEKVGLKLATDAEQAALAKKLATIMIDAPIQFDINKCACKDFDIKNLREGFKEQGFKTLTARIDVVFGKPEEQLGLL